MVVLRALIFVTFGTFAGHAGAQVFEIYKCQDSNGRPLYTNEKKDTAGKKCELVSREVTVVPALKPPPAAAKTGPSGFPKETPSERATAKGRQREILEQELATEQRLLAEAKQKLAEQEAQRNGDERNYAKALERLQPYKDSVETHEKNVEALRRELGNAR